MPVSAPGQKTGRQRRTGRDEGPVDETGRDAHVRKMKPSPSSRIWSQTRHATARLSCSTNSVVNQLSGTPIAFDMRL